MAKYTNAQLLACMALLMLVMAQGCMSIPRPPMEMVGTRLQVMRKTGRRYEDLYAAKAKARADSSNHRYYDWFQVRVITNQDSIWPNREPSPADWRADHVPASELKRYLRRTFHSAEAQDEMASWVSAANDSEIVVTLHSQSGPVIERRFALSQVQYLAINRITRRSMWLRPTTSDATGTLVTVLGFMSVGFSPYLAFGRWSGIESTYIGRLAFLICGGATVAWIGEGYRRVFYGRDDRLYIVIDPKR